MSEICGYGNATEVKVHVIGGRHPEGTLEQEINEWLRAYPTAEVLDIKYGYCAYGGGNYSAMIIYRS